MTISLRDEMHRAENSADKTFILVAPSGKETPAAWVDEFLGLAKFVDHSGVEQHVWIDTLEEIGMRVKEK